MIVSSAMFYLIFYQGLFEMGKVGAPLAAIGKKIGGIEFREKLIISLGILYVIVFSRFLLPNRVGVSDMSKAKEYSRLLGFMFNYLILGMQCLREYRRIVH